MGRAKKALATLQFVEKDKPVKADVTTQKVLFTVTDKKKFDFAKLEAAFKAQDFPTIKVVAGP